jgi:SHS2 domain-containing protein
MVKTMEASFELFQHTADMGIRAWGQSEAELLYSCTAGLYAVAGSLVPSRIADLPRIFSLESDAPHLLVREYLAEMHYLLVRENKLVVSLEVNRFSNLELNVLVTLAKLDKQKSTWEREIKAITYHELELVRTERGLEASFIVDI